MTSGSAGKQGAMLLAGVVGSFVIGIAIASPFDIDVGAGHAVFHLLLGVGLGATWWWLRSDQRPGETRWPFRLALWSTAALAVAQVLEAVAAVPDGEGSSLAHGIPNVVSLAVLQPLVLVALGALVVSAALARRPA